MKNLTKWKFYAREVVIFAIVVPVILLWAFFDAITEMLSDVLDWCTKMSGDPYELCKVYGHIEPPHNICKGHWSTFTCARCARCVEKTI